MHSPSILNLQTNIINYLYFKYLPEKTRQTLSLTCRFFSKIYLYDIHYRKIANFIKEYFNIIDSFPKNIPLSEIVQFSKLIMLGEIYVRTEQSLLNECLASVLWEKERNSLLLEREKMSSYLSEEITNEAKLWDKGPIYIGKEKTSIEKIKHKLHEDLIWLVKCLNSYYKNFVEMKACSEKNKEKYLFFHKFLYMYYKSFYSQYSSILKLILSIKDIRNNYLLKSVEKEIKINRVPILFGGSSHIKNALVLQTLKKMKIPFISLEPRKDRFISNKGVDELFKEGNLSIIDFILLPSSFKKSTNTKNTLSCRECYPNTQSMLDDVYILGDFSDKKDDSYDFPQVYPKLKHTFLHFDLERINGNTEYVGVWIDLGFNLLYSEMMQLEFEIEKLNKS